MEMYINLSAIVLSLQVPYFVILFQPKKAPAINEEEPEDIDDSEEAALVKNIISTGSQIDRLIDRQTDRQTDRHVDRQRSRQKDSHIRKLPWGGLEAAIFKNVISTGRQTC